MTKTHLITLVMIVILSFASFGEVWAQTELIVNVNFASGSTGWQLSGDFYADSRFSNCRSCPGYAYVSNPDGTPGNSLYGTLRQEITIPANATSVTLSFWYYITTQEVGSTGYDVLGIYVENSSGSIIATLGTLSNTSANLSYQQASFDLTSYKGQSIRILFLGTTDNSYPTTFRIDDVSVLTAVPAPSPPTLISPANASTVTTLTPTFTWRKVDNADYYGLYVSEPPYGPSNLVYDNEGLTGTSITLPSGRLENGVTYYWNMRSYNSAGWGSLSGSWYFTTEPVNLLPAPTLYSPDQNAEDVSTTPYFDWSSVSGATNYWLMVAENEDDLPDDPSAESCSNCVISEMWLTSSNYNTPSSTSLSENTEYWWQVQPYEWDGSTVTRQGEYSQHYKFTTYPEHILPDYPAAVWNPADPSNYTVSARPNTYPIMYVIIHVAQGYYSGTIDWFQYPSSDVSAHYVLKSSDGEITQMVRHKDISWHAGNWDYNTCSIGIEHEGYINEPSWFTDQMYESSAALTSYICDFYGIPKTRTYIIGHNEVPGATHTDPGPYWDWDYYMQLVTGLAGDIRIEPLTITIDAEVGGAVSSQSLWTPALMTPASSIKALDISDPNSNLGEISLDEIVIRFRAEESAILHTYRVVDNLSNAQLLAASDTLGKEALPGELLGLRPFVAGAKKIQQIVTNSQSTTEIITSDNSLSASESALVSESIKINIEDHGPGGLFYAKIAQDTDIRDICIELMRRADVVYAHPSPVCHIEAAPNDPLYNRMWNLDRIGMPAAWDISGNTLGGVRVCVVDSGVRISHNELAGRTADQTDVYLGNGDAYGDADPDNDDVSGHGTKCAGIIAAIRDNATLTVGIAPVTIIPVSAGGWDSTTSSWKIYNYTDGVFWGVDRGADVISLSFGSYRSSPYQSELDAAIYAENHGVIVCAGAGNDDGDADGHYPSAIPYYICVAAVDDDDERVSEPKWWWGSNFGDTIDLCAPGQGDVGASNDSILTLDRDSDSDWTNSFNGTSSATPHVAGVCALLAHVNPSLTAQGIRNIIQTTAEDQIGDPSEDVAGWDQFHGYGLINAANAIAMATHSFTIFNDGLANLSVTDIVKRDGDDWLISWNPSTPFSIAPGGSQIVPVAIDPELADIGPNDERLLVYSDDSDESPYPGGVYVNLTITAVSTTVDYEDLARLANEWLWTGQAGGIPEDIMQDGIVNFADFALLALNWLAGTTP